ncbi:hypothetical protein EN852_009695 [Mesorhizobium sp. M2E.F.Ca.ET.209.01.1.1]|uniref:hypothetical protein n=1 Tax=Mesorhizobium sp. M2E.F.Ca.ET.209.01.1.1 TaxID=2500526 RepID=UPI000FD8EBFD|nr:hypothetical protein [Mesorhizobium sp. M2E.F.Ca.ET.209.01.1.1]TGS15896.1 hypothetical protein EN852_009695 [Mesorhizobium sp. M2E.F.Ca.ET.209.01.1.1]
MAKSKQRQQPAPSSPEAPQLPIGIQLGYDPKGPSEPVDIASSKDGWSEFTLSDGTILRAKAVVLDVKKMLGQYTPDGDPVYEMQMTLVSQSRVPEHLKKKG